MLKVFICEDDQKQLERISQIIEDVIIIENMDMKVVKKSQDPEEILDYLKQHEGTGVYFLDVDLKSKMNGIHLGEKIREFDPRGFIIYVTMHAELSYLTFAYKVEALDYIIKDDFVSLPKRIRECLYNIVEKCNTRNTDLQENFYIKSGDRHLFIEYDKIVFFETSETIHKIKLHGEDRQVEFYAQMKEIMNHLDDRFVRCHRSFVINKDKISEVDKKQRIIHFENGEECIASIRGMRELSNYLKRKILQEKEG